MRQPPVQLSLPREYRLHQAGFPGVSYGLRHPQAQQV